MPWKMPAQLEPFRAHIGNTGGNTIEDLMDIWIDGQRAGRLMRTNLPLYLCAVMTAAQIDLLQRLHENGMLPGGGDA